MLAFFFFWFIARGEEADSVELTSAPMHASAPAAQYSAVSGVLERLVFVALLRIPMSRVWGLAQTGGIHSCAFAGKLALFMYTMSSYLDT
jgi:hypothetical protein